jgi:hypothetical protein
MGLLPTILDHLFVDHIGHGGRTRDDKLHKEKMFIVDKNLCIMA